LISTESYIFYCCNVVGFFSLVFFFYYIDILDVTIVIAVVGTDLTLNITR